MTNNTISIKNTLDKLFSLHIFGVKLGLENIIKFLDHIGNPQNNLQTIHIAGSNGKGSVASFIASVFTEADYKTGLYTSPHFVKFNERIRINGIEIEDEYISSFYDKHELFINENKLTFFEVTTAMAFQYFYDQKVDYAIIEAGLGGRLDATNVLNPIAVVFTSISLEHTNILGKTIEEITKEKAEIIKKECKVFTGILPSNAELIIIDKCREMNCSLYRVEDYTVYKNQNLSFYSEEIEIKNIETPLKGIFQKYNAALAALTLSKISLFDNQYIIQKGIKNVIQNTGLQGRYEIHRKEPYIVFDSAHNPEGIKNFINSYLEEAGKYSKKTVLFGAMNDKAVEEMIIILNDFFDEIVFTDINYERCMKKEELIKISEKNNIKATVTENPNEFLNNFYNKSSDESLVILGSMYILGEIKRQILEK